MILLELNHTLLACLLTPKQFVLVLKHLTAVLEHLNFDLLLFVLALQCIVCLLAMILFDFLVVMSRLLIPDTALRSACVVLGLLVRWHSFAENVLDVRDWTLVSLSIWSCLRCVLL